MRFLHLAALFSMFVAGCTNRDVRETEAQSVLPNIPKDEPVVIQVSVDDDSQVVVGQDAQGVVKKSMYLLALPKAAIAG